MLIDVKIVNKIIISTVAQNWFSYSIHIFVTENHIGNWACICNVVFEAKNCRESTGCWTTSWKNTIERGLGWVSTGIRTLGQCLAYLKDVSQHSGTLPLTVLAVFSVAATDGSIGR